MDKVSYMLKPWVAVILRVGLAVVFLSFGVDKILNPDFGAAEMQAILGVSFDFANQLNFLTALFELALAALLLVGWQIRYVAPLAALWLLTIVIALSTSAGIANPAVSRDIGLFAAALALWGLSGRE